MLWPDSNQRTRLLEIHDNLLDRIAEAECEAWLGGVERLRVSLTGAKAKLAPIDRTSAHATPMTAGATRTTAEKP